jgi:hypothetical protein
MSKENMLIYLNDHLTGAAGALDLIHHISELHPSDKETLFYKELHTEITNDQKILKALIHRLGAEESTLRQVAGRIAEKISRIKLEPTKIEEGSIGLFESLEVLALGIQGKHLLWKAILALKNPYPEWEGIDFKKLEQQAKDQRDRVEKKRIDAARQSLSSSN